MAWTFVPQTDGVPRSSHTQEPVAETRYEEVGPRHANMSQDKEVTQALPRSPTKNATGTKLTIWSRNLSLYVEGNYPDEGPYHDVAVVLVAL